jgi:hypothetical protein
MHGRRKEWRCSKQTQILCTTPYSAGATGHLHTRQLLTADKEQLRQTLPKSHLSRKNTNIIRLFCLYTSQVAVYRLRLLRQTAPWQWLNEEGRVWSRATLCQIFAGQSRNWTGSSPNTSRCLLSVSLQQYTMHIPLTPTPYALNNCRRRYLKRTKKKLLPRIWELPASNLGLQIKYHKRRS